MRKRNNIYERVLKAATKGDAQAQYRLGSIIAKGKGVPSDLATAMYWYECAAHQNLAKAKRKMKILKKKAPIILTDQVHGDHNDAVLGQASVEFITDSIQQSAPDRRAEIFVRMPENEEGKGVPKFTRFHSLRLIGEPISFLSLFAAKETGDTYEFLSIFPEITDGVELRLIVDEILEWENGFSAVIVGHTGNGFDISFFMTDYAFHKYEIKKGTPYTFKVSALAYLCQEPEQHSVCLEGEKAVKFLAQQGKEPEINEEGEIQPVTIGLDNMVAFIQLRPIQPDNAEYQARIEQVQEVSAQGQDFYRIVLPVEPEEDICMPFYVRQDRVAFKPRKGMPVQGIAWIQGHMVE